MATNNTMFTTLKAAFEQATGKSNIAAIDIQGIVDMGKDTTILTSKDTFVNALVNQIYKNIYTDAAYTDRTNDIFYEDASAYGAACQVISVDLPEVVENPAWNVITSGTTKLHDTPVTVPVVDGQIFGNADAWAVNIAFSGEQLDTAFDSVEKLTTFYNYVRMVVENSVMVHRKEMASLNRNSWIANVVSAKTAHPYRVVNLVQDYVNEMGITGGMTVRNFLANPTALAWAAGRLAQYRDFLTDYSTLFTGDGKNKFVPENRLVVQMLSSFENLFRAEIVGQLYNDRVVELPLHRTVTKWQGQKTSTKGLDFNTLSTVNVKVGTGSGGTVNLSGVVGIMVDKMAIMHTTVSRRVGVDRDDVKDITLYSYQNVDRYMNNLNLAGIVITLADVSA